MNVENNQNTKTADPFEAFRNMRDSYLEAMSKTMIDAVNSEEYAQATGTLLTNYLTVTAPFREALDKTMVMALEQLSLPSRQQVTSLAERFANVEMRLDDMEAKLDRILESLSTARLDDMDAKLARIVELSSATRLDEMEAKLDRILEFSAATRLTVPPVAPLPKQLPKDDTKPVHQASGKK
jgi:hypothetical protein